MHMVRQMRAWVREVDRLNLVRRFQQARVRGVRMHNPSPCVRWAPRLGSMAHIQGLVQCSFQPSNTHAGLCLGTLIVPFFCHFLLSRLLLLLGSCSPDMHPLFSCLLFSMTFMSNVKGRACAHEVYI